MNAVDIFLIVLLAAILGFAALALFRRKKSGKGCCGGGGCSGNCGACPYDCERKKKE